MALKGSLTPLTHNDHPSRKTNLVNHTTSTATELKNATIIAAKVLGQAVHQKVSESHIYAYLSWQKARRQQRNSPTT